MDTNITVVVITYNMLYFLKKCVKSIKRQSIINFKLLIIDNGSSDGTKEWLARVEQRDKRLQVIRLETNAGLPTARNIALDAVCTEYFTFVDADDLVKRDYLEKLWTIAQKEHAQIVTCNVATFRKIPLLSRLHHPVEWYKNHTEARTIFDYPEQFYELAAWAKLLRTDYVKSLKCRFVDNSLFCEEVPFSTSIFLMATKLAVVDKALYLYRLREDSLSHSFGVHQINDFIFSMKKQDALIKMCSVENYDLLRCIFETRFLLANLLLSRIEENAVMYYFMNMNKVINEEQKCFLSKLFEELSYAHVLFEAILTGDEKQYIVIKEYYS